MRAVRHTHWFQQLRHRYAVATDATYREQDREPADAFQRFCDEDGGVGYRADVRPQGGTQKTALIIGQAYLPFTKIEALMIKALQMAGFRTVVMGDRKVEYMRYGWLAGNRNVFDAGDYAPHGNPAWAAAQMPRLNTLDDWLALEYEGVHVGRFTIASGLRRLRVGQLDFQDPATRQTLQEILEFSVYHAMGAAGLMDAVKPDLVLVMDRGYSGYGEAFDLALHRGIDAVTWTLGYKRDRLVVKRYNRANERDHFLCPSAETWERLRSMPWSAEQGQAIRQELFDCYQSQDWFSFVGTQFEKELLSKQATRQALGLPADASSKKVAIIFPHILWDGSFFSGKDLFTDYTQWLVETIRAAIANPRLQWLVKLHPAHVVKAKQNNDSRQPSEVRVIEQHFGSLPSHITLVYPDSPLSTYSLMEVADYAVTVRGTVGIEAALFGIPVVTGGTGRYDRRGFTVDSSTREEYLARLASLDTYERLSPTQIEMAERFAYGTFFGRPLRLSSVSLDYHRDGKATPRFTVRCQTREEWLAARDMQLLSRWLADGKAEDLLDFPVGSTAQAGSQ
jgi:hypothetical protein